MQRVLPEGTATSRRAHKAAHRKALIIFIGAGQDLTIWSHFQKEIST